MDFCCGVTLFHPDLKDLKKILQYSSVFSKIYIFDNTEGEGRYENKKFFEESNFKDQYIYISTGINEGLSRAFNNMCSEAIKLNFNYICLFDQDSIISNEDLLKIIKLIENNTEESVGIYAPKIDYQHKKENAHNEKELSEKEWVITSGSFINLLAYQVIGGFDENYFIDRIDYDYCYFLREKKYKIIVLNNAILNQSLGDKKKSILGPYSSHGAIRHYYMYRNRLYFYLYKKNYNFKQYINVILSSFRQIIYILCCEDNKFEKLKMICLAQMHYHKRRWGKL